MLTEQKSKFDEDLEAEDRKHDWYTYIFERMTENLTKPDNNLYNRLRTKFFILEKLTGFDLLIFVPPISDEFCKFPFKASFDKSVVII
jgi:hypothetical protein